MSNNSVKDDLLKEIDQRIDKRSKLKAQAALPKDLQHHAFQFFKRVDDIRSISPDGVLDWTLLVQAQKAFEVQVLAIDRDVTLQINFIEGNISTVDVKWSELYQARYGVDPITTIDVSDMLLSTLV